eukprot:521912-Amphidinium_carterae.1
MNQDKIPTGWKASFIHSRVSKMDQRLESGGLGDSQSDTVVLGMMLDEDVLINDGALATNGFARSIRMKSLKVTNENCKLMSLVKVAPALKTWLTTEEAMSLTHQTVSHYESLLTMPAMSEFRIYTLEVIRGMLLGGCSKIESTINPQAPELGDTFEELKKELKEAYKAEVLAELAEKEKNNDNETEVIITMKRAKYNNSRNSNSS